MIKESEVFNIGKLLKPHGIKGEIAFAFDNDVFDRCDCPYLICLIDGIFVPFFVEKCRFKGADIALIKFEDLNSEDDVRRMSHLDVYFPRSYFENNESEVEYSWNYFIGFSVVDLRDEATIGVISEVDDSTINVLFKLDSATSDGDEIIIPASDDFIVEIDDNNKIIKMDLPEGLLE